MSRERSSLRSSASASNLYTHFRQVHPEIYVVILPIVQSREKNKRRAVQNTSLHGFLDNSRQRNVNKGMVQFFTRPTVCLSLIELTAFRKFINCLNLRVHVPTRATISNSLSKKFNEVLTSIQNQVLKSEYVVLKFDGWSSVRNDTILGFMFSYLKEDLLLRTRTIGTFCETGGQDSDKVAKVIRTAIQSRCSKRTPDFLFLTPRQ